MDDYEFKCINYKDLSDREMCREWLIMRATFRRLGMEQWAYRVDEGRIQVARKAYGEAGYLARHFGGKASLLIDGGLGFCMVRLEHVDAISASGRLEKKRIITLLSRADSFHFTPDLEYGVCLKLSYKAFSKDESQ